MKIFHFIYLMFTLLVAAYSFNNPAYNWDMLGYSACVLELSGVERDDLHAQTYQTVKSSIPPDKYQELVTADIPFRVQMAHRPEDFLKQIQVFRVKPLYIYLTFLITKTGLSVIDSATLLSVLSAALVCLLIYHWLCRWLTPPLSLMLSMMSVVFVRLPYVSSLITPDALSILVLMGAFYFLFERHHILIGVLLFIMSVFVRPDNVIVSVFVVIYMMFWAGKDIKIKKVGGCFLLLGLLFFLALIFYLPAGKLGAPLHRAFLGASRDEADFKTVFSLAAHLKMIELGIVRLFFDKLFLATSHFFIVLGILAAVQARQAIDHMKERRDVINMALMTIAAHFILFPIFEDRFFAVYHLLILMMSLGIFLINKVRRPFTL